MVDHRNRAEIFEDMLRIASMKSSENLIRFNVNKESKGDNSEFEFTDLKDSISLIKEANKNIEDSELKFSHIPIENILKEKKIDLNSNFFIEIL